MKVISLHDKIYDIVKEYPEIRQPVIDLGFVHMQEDAMLNTAGKIMTLAKAAKRHDVSYDDFKNAFEPHGFQIKEQEL